MYFALTIRFWNAYDGLLPGIKVDQIRAFVYSYNEFSVWNQTIYTCILSESCNLQFLLFFKKNSNRYFCWCTSAKAFEPRTSNMELFKTFFFSELITGNCRKNFLRSAISWRTEVFFLYVTRGRDRQNKNHINSNIPIDLNTCFDFNRTKKVQFFEMT